MLWRPRESSRAWGNFIWRSERTQAPRSFLQPARRHGIKSQRGLIGIGCIHPLQFMTGAPGVREEDFVGAGVVADDQTHVAAAHLAIPGQWRLFLKGANAESPQQRHALVCMLLDDPSELLQ